MTHHHTHTPRHRHQTSTQRGADPQHSRVALWQRKPRTRSESGDQGTGDRHALCPQFDPHSVCCGGICRVYTSSTLPLSLTLSLAQPHELGDWTNLEHVERLNRVSHAPPCRIHQPPPIHPPPPPTIHTHTKTKVNFATQTMFCSPPPNLLWFQTHGGCTHLLRVFDPRLIRFSVRHGLAHSPRLYNTRRGGWCRPGEVLIHPSQESVRESHASQC
jgi:hypothetical protein